jgi:hypothetical protein
LSRTENGEQYRPRPFFIPGDTFSALNPIRALTFQLEPLTAGKGKSRGGAGTKPAWPAAENRFRQTAAIDEAKLRLANAKLMEGHCREAETGGVLRLIFRESGPVSSN